MASSDVIVGEAGGGVGEGIAPAGTRQQICIAQSTHAEGREGWVRGSWEQFKVLLQDRSVMPPSQTGFPRDCGRAGGARCPHMTVAKELALSADS